MTALDGHVLESLGESLGDPHFARVLVEKYCTLLPGRIERLTTALHDHDVDTALDAAKSLRVSSTMVGALELAQLGALMEAEIQRGSLATARGVAPALPAAQQRADVAVAAYLSR